MKKWIIVANSNTCVIYLYHRKANELILLKEILHPENKLKANEILADRPGNYKNGSGSVGGVYASPSDPEEVKIDNFAREIAIELDSARNRHEYDTLVLIMAAHMEGLLFQHLNKNVKALVKQTMQKNIIHLSEPELLDYLRETLI